jgi:hypothetical protein
MAKPHTPDDPQAQAAALSLAEKILIFCIASKTEWERAGITGTTIIAMMVKELIEHDASGELALTKQGHAVLAALLMTEGA